MAESKMIPEDIEKFLVEHYFNLNFIDNVDNYRCTDCNSVMMLRYVANCGHNFCQNCKKVLGDGVEGRRCPSCVKPILKMDRIDKPEYIKNVLELKVFCPYTNNECDFKGTLSVVVGHAKNCQHSAKCLQDLGLR